MGMTIPIPGSSYFECRVSLIVSFNIKIKKLISLFHRGLVEFLHFDCMTIVPFRISLQIDIFHRDSIKVGVSEPGKTYVWREQGYTSCSASCLGGVEELIVNCIREDTGKVVSPFLCSPETKPEARIRTCNDRPCPPRWNYSDYSPCSKSCGIGIREREVTMLFVRGHP